MSWLLGVRASEAGFLLLRLVSLAGWGVTVEPHGDGVLVTARRRGAVVRERARSAADAALPLLEATRRVDRAGL